MVTIRSSAGTNEDSTFSVVVLPEPVPPLITMFSRPPHAGAQQRGDRRCHRAERDEVVHGEGIGRELPDGQQRAVEGDGRHDGIDPAAVGQARVHHGAGLVDAAADPGHDLLDGPAQVGLVGEARVHGVQAAAALDVHLIVPVDHDLGHLGVAQVGLERSVAQDVVENLVRDAHPVDARHRRLFAPQHDLQRFGDSLLQLALIDVRVVQPRAECLKQAGVHAALYRGERVDVPCVPPAPRPMAHRAPRRVASRCAIRSLRLMPSSACRAPGRAVRPSRRAKRLANRLANRAMALRPGTRERSGRWPGSPGGPGSPA